MKNQTLLTLALAMLLASAVHADQEMLAKSIADARAETARTADQLKATVGALNALTKQKKGDLRPAYNDYCAEVVKTEAASNSTKSRVKWMSGEGQQYFQSWQQTVNGISNDKLRKKSQKRLDSVQESYGKVQASLQQAADKFAPFLSDLSDVQKALASDITPGGIKAIRSTVRTANWDHQFVDQAVNSALKEMQKMEKALSPEVKQS